MGIDETRQDEAALRVEDICLRPDVLLDISRPSNGDDPPVAARETFRPEIRRVFRIDAGVRQD